MISLNLAFMLFYGSMALALAYFTWLFYRTTVERKELAEKYEKELTKLEEEIEAWSEKLRKLEEQK